MKHTWDIMVKDEDTKASHFAYSLTLKGAVEFVRFWSHKIKKMEVTMYKH